MNEAESLLDSMRGVELPPVSASIAPGWWIVLLLIIGLCLLVFFFHQRWRKRLWQRQAKQALQDIRQRVGKEPSVAILSSCSQLARKLVLAVDQRDQVANLHGEAWLQKLDDVCKRPEFSQGIGRLLVDQAYQKQPQVSEHDLSDLLESMDVLINAAGRYQPQRLQS